MKKIYIGWFLSFSISILLLFTNSFANDTVGTTAAGGIFFSKMPGISIDREELFISLNKVKVSYLFNNHTNKDITTQVFFPLPPYQSLGANGIWDSEVGITPGAPFTNFTVNVQGQLIQYNTIERAVLQGEDITQKLKAAGIPLNPELVAGKIPNNNADQITGWQNKAKQLSLLDKNNKPLWQKQTLFSWTQTFPANQVLLIEHTYRPAAGAFYAGVDPQKNTDQIINETMQRIKTTFRLDINKMVGGEEIKNWLSQRINQPANSSGIFAYFYNISYILTTGANWGGPIKNFNLTIAEPLNGVIAYNSFYDNQKITKIDSAKYIRIFIQNFTPRKDLQILFGTTTNITD